MDAAHGLASGELVFGAGDPCNAEIHHPELAVVQQHDVLGFDIPVNHAVAMGMVEGFQDLGNEMDGLPAGQLAAPLVEVLPQGHAVHILHHDILEVVADRDVVDLYDVGVVEQRNGFGFVLEPPHQIRVVHQFLPQHLDGHFGSRRNRAVLRHDHRLVDIGHAAGPDQAFDPVEPIQRFADQIIHGAPPSVPRPAAAR